MNKRSSLNVRIDATPMYRNGELFRIKVTQSTNGQLMRGHMFPQIDMAIAKEYMQVMASRFHTHGARVKVHWPFA